MYTGYPTSRTSSQAYTFRRFFFLITFFNAIGNPSVFCAVYSFIFQSSYVTNVSFDLTVATFIRLSADSASSAATECAMFGTPRIRAMDSMLDTAHGQ